MKRLALVMDQLCNAGLQLKPRKCEHAQKEVYYLGHIVSVSSVQPNPSKTQAVSSHAVPRDV